MLRLTLEIIPFGVEDAKGSLGKVEISNIGGSTKIGNYKVSFLSNSKNAEPYSSLCGVSHMEATIKRFSRDKGAWKLVQLALNKLFQERLKAEEGRRIARKITTKLDTCPTCSETMVAGQCLSGCGRK